MLALYVMLGTLSFAFVILAVAMKQGKRQRRLQMEALSQELGGGEVRDLHVHGFNKLALGFEVTLDGRKLKLAARMMGKLPVCLIQVPGPPLPLVVFRRERKIDRVGRWLFLNREVQTGDVDFDRDVYIETDEEEPVVRRVFDRSPALEAIGGAVRGHRAVVLSREGVGGQVLLSRDPSHTIDAIRNSLPTFERISHAIGELAGGSGAGIRQPARGDRMAMVALFALPLVYLVPMVIQGLKADSWEPYLATDAHALHRLCGRTFLLICLVAFFWIRGHSRSLRNFVTFALAGIFSLMLPAAQLVAVANARFDHSPVVTHETRVKETVKKSGRYHTYHYVRFESWITPGVTGSIEVEPALWKSFDKGDTIALDTRAGRFGWMWIADVRKQ